MGKLIFIFALALCTAICQSPKPKPVEPEVLGVPFLLDSDNQVLKPLAGEPWKHATKRQGMFVVNVLIEVAGEHSPLRITIGKPIEFVFKVEHPESVKLRQSAQGKNERMFLIVRSHGEGSTEEVIPSIPATLTKYGESSYKLAPDSILAAGEYAITYGSKVMTFGIDSNK